MEYIPSIFALLFVYLKIARRCSVFDIGGEDMNSNISDILVYASEQRDIDAIYEACKGMPHETLEIITDENDRLENFLSC